MDIFDKEKTVISCFDLTGNMVRPWAEAGYLCYCVDIQHPQGEKRQGNIIHVGADMRDCEKIADYLIGHYEDKNLVLNVYLHGCGRFRGTMVQGQGAVRAVPVHTPVLRFHPHRGMDARSVPYRKPRFHHLHLLAQA